MSGASEAHPSPAASVCPTARISTIVELRSIIRLARSKVGINPVNFGNPLSEYIYVVGLFQLKVLNADDE
jgi:hypothetical protein